MAPLQQENTTSNAVELRNSTASIGMTFAMTRKKVYQDEEGPYHGTDALMSSNEHGFRRKLDDTETYQREEE